MFISPKRPSDVSEYHLAGGIECATMGGVLVEDWQRALMRLFAEPAILLELGYAPVARREGLSRRHRRPEGKTEQSVPIDPDTLRDELARLTEDDWISLQERRLGALYRRRRIHSKKVVVDGSGLGDGMRLVTLSALTGDGLVPLAFAFLTGDASEKGVVSPGKDGTLTV